MKDRILQIMKSKGMSQQEFSRATGIAPASLSSIFNGRTAPTMKHAEALHRHFPELSINWLLFGEGEMNSTNANSGEEGSEDLVLGAQGNADGPFQDVDKMNASFAGGFDFPDAPSEQYPGMVSSPSAGATGAPARMGAPYGDAAHSTNVRAREANSAANTAAGMGAKMSRYPNGVNAAQMGGYPGMDNMVNFQDIRQRKIVEIRIFFDDGTFETFKGN